MNVNYSRYSRVVGDADFHRDRYLSERHHLPLGDLVGALIAVDAAVGCGMTPTAGWRYDNVSHHSLLRW